MNKTKNYLLIGILLFGITFVVNGCKDDFENQDTIETRKSPFSMRTIYGEELNQKQKIFKQINTFNKRSLNKSGVYNEQYDFTIETAFAKYIESEDSSFHTYTFLVHREEDNGLLENLVFTSQLTVPETYLSKLVAYNFLDSGEVEVKHADLSINSNDYLNKSGPSWSCYTTYSCSEWRTYCDDCNDPNSDTWEECVSYVSGTSCELSYTYISAGPSSGGGGGGGTSTGGGGFGDGIWYGGGSGGSAGNPDIATSPVTLQEIEKLTIQTNNSKIKNKIEYLKSRLSIENHELGSEFRKVASPISNLQIIDYDVIECNIVNDNWVEFPPVQINSKVRIHLHQNFTSSGSRTSTIFGEIDVIESARFYTDLKNLLPDLKGNGNLSNIVVTRHGLYALRVSNTGKAENFINNLSNPNPLNPYLTNEQHYNQTYTKDLIEFIIKKCNTNGCSEQEIGEHSEEFFLSFFIKMNTGLDLYYSSEIDGNGNYIWVKK